MLDCVRKNLKITIAYILKDGNGKIIEEIPQSHPVVYIHGLSDFVPPGLQNAMDGLKIGQRAVVPLSAHDAYGSYQDELVIEVTKEELQDIGQLWVGMEIEMAQDDFAAMESWKAPDGPSAFLDDDNLGEPFLYILREIREKTVLLDGNHPLAGMDLTFEIQIVGIDQPSVTELEQGYPDFPEGEEPGGEWDDHFGDNRSWR